MFTQHTLSNGLPVIIAPQRDTHSVTVLILFGVGSRYEEHRINGISHVVEHMIFKGTDKRPTTLDISQELDGVGAEYNAYTGKDYTGYYVKVSNEHQELALDVVSDMLFHSKFDADEHEKEKRVICEEIHMYKDNPVMHIDTVLEEELFDGNPLGWDIAGDDERVLGMTRQDLVDYFKSHYVPGNAVLGIAGNVTEDVLERLESYFGSWQSDEKKAHSIPFEKQEQTIPRVRIDFRDSEQVQMALGFPAYEYDHVDLPVVTVLSTILGGTMSSRLFISVREKRGLAYSVSSSAQQFSDTGSFSIQAGLDKTRLEDALKVIKEEVEKMCKEVVNDQELVRAKEHIKGKLALRLEDSQAVVSWYVNQKLLSKEVLTLEEKMERIMKVSAEDIMRVAQDIFDFSKCSLALIGPFKDGEVFKKILA